MPRRPAAACTYPGCPNTTDAGRCPQHRTQRPSAARRGYDTQHRDRFRTGVLTRDPDCVLCGTPATVADHWPLSRRQLEATGQDPNDPQHGRGLCKSCHDKETAQHQPGGWNAR